MFRNAGFVMKGLREFTSAGYARASRSFDATDLSATKAKGKVAVVTGANAGIGREVALSLAEQGMRVECVCRNAERGATAVAEIKQQSGNDDVHLQVADVSCVADVRRVVESLGDTPVHVLVNNAGVLINEPGTSKEGLELSFATNTLGAFALTEMALPLLKRAAAAEAEAGDDAFTPRVVTVSSGGMYTASLDSDDLQNKKMAKKWDGVHAYALDKRRQVACTEHWAAEHGKDGVVFAAMHPGWSDTPGVSRSLPGFKERMGGKLRTPAEGADTITWLSLVDAKKIQSGEFYLDRAVAKKHLLFSGTGYSDKERATMVDKLKPFIAA